MADEIRIEERTEVDTAVVRRRVAHDGIGPFIGEAFGAVIGALTAQGNPPAGMPFARYSMVADGFDVEAGFPCTRPVQPTGEVIASTLPAGPVATVTYTGPYEGVAQAYSGIEAWLAEHGYVSTDAPWESYLDGPEVAMPRTVVSVPCTKQA